MPITVGSNIAALRAQRRLNEGSESLSRVYERLSSGQRINRASDDAAGLAIAATLETNARVLNQASRNVNDGISLLNIVDGALHALSDIVVRISELAEQSANGTYSTTQREALDVEAQALSAEYRRIGQSTSFNGTSLLDGSLGSISLQVGINSASSARIELIPPTVATYSAPSGTFQAEISTYSGTGGNDVGHSSGDFNSDGKTDIAFFTGGDTGVFLNNGNGTFSVKFIASGVSGNGYERTYSYDANGDGFDDVVFANPANLYVVLGNGNGTFKARLSYSVGLAGFSIGGVAQGDFNGDGILDIAATEYGQGVRVLLGNADGSFGAAILNNSVITQVGGAAGDINEDGKVDYLVGTFTGVQVYVGNGNGTFSTGSLLTIASRSPSLVDLNGDGHLDFAAGGGNSTNFQIALGNGNGTFKAGINYAAGTQQGFDQVQTYVADLNEDDAPDIITTGAASVAIGVALNNGDGTFKTPTSYPFANASYSAFAVDLNGDGATDIIGGKASAGYLGVLYGTIGQTAGIAPFSLRTADDALQTLDAMRTKIGAIADALGKIGATQSRLLTAAETIAVSRENSLGAAARIKDADIASDSAELTRLTILQQAGSAVLAQANQQPSLALQLLHG